jgi:hypothetical protein
MADSRQTKRRFLRQQSTLNPRPQSVRHESFQNSEFFDPGDLLQVKYEMLWQVEIDQHPVSQPAMVLSIGNGPF